MNKNSKCPLDCAVRGCGTELCRRYKDYQQGRADERQKFAQTVKKFINTYRYGNDDLIAFIEEYKEQKGEQND